MLLRHASIFRPCTIDMQKSQFGELYLRSEKSILAGGFEAARQRRGKGFPRGHYLSWKVRYRILLWFFIQMIKLYKARSLLYRSQILQANIRWKALDEIYKIYMLLHRSDFNISSKFREILSHFSAKIFKLKFRYFWIVFTDFCSDVDEILSEFRR